MSDPTRPRLIGIRPWRESGPGWANDGVDYITEDAVGRHQVKCRYLNEFSSSEEYLAWSVALEAYASLERIWMEKDKEKEHR